jgi:predicted DNA-binding protein (MmcQ/YjbR family)
MTSSEFRSIALSFPATEEKPHFDRAAFKIITKRIFATLHEESATANLKLSLSEQKAFSALDKKNIFPIDNAWGKQGWTTFNLKKIDPDTLKEAMHSAYQEALKPTKKK